MSISKEQKAFADYAADKNFRTKANAKVPSLKLVEITLKKAKYLLGINWKKQRAISKQKIKDYTYEMVNEGFSFSLATIDVARHIKGDFEYLFNGQHTLLAIVNYLTENKGVKCPRILIRTHYVENLKEVTHLFNRIDVGRLRSFEHRVSATELKKILNNHVISGKVAHALGTIQKRFKHVGGHQVNARNAEIIEKMAVQYAESIKKYFSYYDACSLSAVKNFMKKKEVIGIMLICLDQCRDIAEEFLEKLISTNVGLEELGTLKEAIMSKHYCTVNHRRPYYVARSFMQFWNAHYKGKDLSNMPEIKNTNSDIVLNGTDWKSNKVKS